MTNPWTDSLRKLLWPLIYCLAVLLSYWLAPALHLRPDNMGLMPRNWLHLSGIATSAFAHGNAEHLLSNVLSLLFSSWLLHTFYSRLAFPVILVSWLGSGILMFLFARTGVFHIGASAAIYSVVFFLLTGGLLGGHTSLRTVAIITILHYGSLVWGFLPLDNGVSWDGHLSGAAIGILLGIFFRKQYRKAYATPKPDWYREEDNEEDEYRKFNS
ncbi:MAG: rhomboid family intramembrane serine protease [Bacteroidetes bacterium]|nr:rhomboid family intramembrane serine protease [Bacteroidota bacterium]